MRANVSVCLHVYVREGEGGREYNDLGVHELRYRLSLCIVNVLCMCGRVRHISCEYRVSVCVGGKGGGVHLFLSPPPFSLSLPPSPLTFSPPLNTGVGLGRLC